MRKTLLVCTFATVLAGRAIAADVDIQTDNNAPVRFHHVNSVVIIHRITKSFQFGSGLIPIDKVRSVVCRSVSGCVITARATVFVDGSPCPVVSAYIDGSAMKPAVGPFNCYGETVFQQSAWIAQGEHTFQTQLTQQTGGSGTLYSLDAEYTIYDH